MADFEIRFNFEDVNVFFGKHPELVAEFNLIALARMHSDLLDEIDLAERLRHQEAERRHNGRQVEGQEGPLPGEGQGNPAPWHSPREAPHPQSEEIYGRTSWRGPSEEG